MNRNRILIIIVIVVLFLGCNLSACLGGLIVGGGLGTLRAHRLTRLSHSTEPQDRWLPTPLPLPGRPQEPEHVRAAALIVEVTADGPADQAGIKVGDLVLSIDGQEIEQDTDLKALLARYEPRDRVELTVWRGGRQRDIQVTLGRSQDGDMPYLGLTYRVVPFALETD
jgi:membrane-associated protease RseP (regulator of RpoE activity)